MASVQIGDVTKSINNLLEEYVKEVDKMMEEELPKVGKEAVKELKKTSPNRTGKYAKSWKSKIEKARLGSKVTVYNTVYYLTHLLEHGHAKVNGGYVPGKPHIKPAQDHAEKKAVELITKGIESVR